MFEKITSFFRIREFNANLKFYNDSVRLFRVVLCNEFSGLFSQELGADLGGILAAQVVNYLMGEDLGVGYAKASDQLKREISKIKDQVVECADARMKADGALREFVVYQLRMRTVFRFAGEGQQYLGSPDKKRIESILVKYGPEFPNEASPPLYENIVKRFMEAKREFIPGSKPSRKS